MGYAQVAVLALAAAGKFSLWAAVAVDAGTALVVIANGMTLLRWRRAQSACAATCSHAAKICCNSGAAASAAAHDTCPDAKASGCSHAGKAPGKCCSQKAEQSSRSSENRHCQKSHGHNHSHNHSHSHSHGEDRDTAPGQQSHAHQLGFGAREQPGSCCSGGGSRCSQGTAAKYAGCGGSAAHDHVQAPACDTSTHAGGDVEMSRGCSGTPTLGHDRIPAHACSKAAHAGCQPAHATGCCNGAGHRHGCLTHPLEG